MSDERLEELLEVYGHLSDAQIALRTARIGYQDDGTSKNRFLCELELEILNVMDRLWRCIHRDKEAE